MAGAVLALAAVAVMLSAAPAAADVNITGDWVISGPATYSNEIINVSGSNGTNSTDGNVTITPTGILTLDNVTLLLPAFRSFVNDGVLDATDSTFDGPRWFFGLNGTATLTRVRILNATQVINSTVGGTWVGSTGVAFDNVTWNATSGASIVHIASPINFTDNILKKRVTVSIEVNPSFANRTVAIARNSFDVGYSSLYALIIVGDAIGFPNAFDVHDNTFHDEYVAITVSRADPQASYLVRNNFVNNTGWGSLLEAGDTFGSQRFDGNLTATNNTVVNAVRGVRLYGNAALTTVIYVDRLVAANVTTGVLANDGTVVLTNSTIGPAGTTYSASSEGHIRIYSTIDLAFDTNTPGSNGSIEHFGFLDVRSIAWAGAVPFLGDVLTLRNASGASNLVLDPATWTPSMAVQWGVYSGSPRVDNRNLRPFVLEASMSFDCTPLQFYFADGMAPVDVVCTDGSLPQLSVSSPAPGSIFNQSSFTVYGNIDEGGAGLASFEYSLDNASFQSFPLDGNDTFNWNVTLGPLADRAYTVYFRAIDRAGNTAYLAHASIRIDTTFPGLALGAFPPFATSSPWPVNGSTEPFATLTIRRAYGWNHTVVLGSTGTFSVLVPLDEGRNIFSIHIVDRAGNAVEGEALIVVDTVAPPVIALLDGQPTAALWTGNSTVHVSGMCEPNATVKVGGAAVTRVGPAFGADVALDPGRNDLDIVCTDEAGNAAHWYGIAFVDDEPPSLVAAVDGAVSLGPGRYLVVSTLVGIVGTVADSGSGLDEVSVNGVPVAVLGDGQVTVSLEIPEGETAVLVAAVDRVGNTASVSFAVVRDSTRPSATFEWVESGAPIIDLGGRASTRGSQVVLRIVLSEAARILFADTSLDLPEGETLYPVELASGSNKLSISFNDTAGNSGPSVDLYIFKDSAPPEITIYTPTQDARVFEPAVEVTGQAEPGALVHVGGLAVAVTATGEFHIFVELAEGENQIAVEAEDGLGNAANLTVAVTYIRPQVPPVVGPSGGLELPLLLIGLLAGAAAGALAMRGRGVARRDAGRDESVGEQSPPTGPTGEAKGPKGPRGPAPPP